MKSNRENQILELLAVEKRLEVAQLSELLNVSQVTIRKDLDVLEQKGIIQREHGWAVLCSTDDIHGRIAYHYREKRKIAEWAAHLIKDGDTVMIESGSCCALLADVLAETRKDLTVITNSAFIAAYIRGKCQFQIILLGGIYQPDAQVMVGPMVRQCAENFFVDLFFIGVDGYSERTGFTNQDQLRAQAVRDMAHQTERIVVLTESEKFSRHGVVPMNLKVPAVTVVTDDKLDSGIKAALQQKNIQVHTVEVD